MMVPWLTIILLLPSAFAVLLVVIPRSLSAVVKAVTVVGTLVTAAIVAGVVIDFAGHPAAGNVQALLPNGSAPSSPLALQYVERHDWIPSIGASYHLGIDGLAAWMIALNAAVFLIGAVVVSRRRTERLKFFCGLLLITETATAGVILSADLLLFYLFWEGMLIPLYFLLSAYGTAKRGRAAGKFLVYTVAGSLLMLVSIIYLYFTSKSGGQRGTFDLQALLLSAAPSTTANVLTVGGHSFSLLSGQQLAFLGFAIAFAIKVPMVPFHTWLPDLYESAPPSVLAFFAGIVSKLGAFGFIRYCLALFPGPAHDFQVVFLVLALLSIIYGAVMALAEVDIKRIVAYSSISHLGFITLGIWSLNGNGLNGAIIQIINHGVIIAALFLIVGWIEVRTGTRDRRELAGLERRMPWLYFFFLVVTLAGLGMPGMNGFVGEFTIMLGAFQVNPVYAVVAGVGVVLACWYMLRLHQGLMHEPVQSPTARVADLRFGEGSVLAPLVAVMVLLGVFPHPVGVVTGPSVSRYEHQLGTSRTGNSGSCPPPESPLQAQPPAQAPSQAGCTLR